MQKKYEFELFGEKARFFFDKFPYVEYDILGNGSYKKIKNFFKRFDFREKVLKYGSIYTKWVVRDDDTPQVIAHKLYGSTHYYWIVLMINRIIDPNFDFPLAYRELEAYIDKKYGSKKHDVHHYESVDTGDIADLPDGIIVDETYPHKKAISNYEYEVNKNDKKRHILLLRPEYLEDVLLELETILESDFRRVR